MKINNGEIVLKDKKGSNKYKIIASFISDEDKTFLLYTNNEKDKDGFIKTYASIYEDNKLLPIENDEDWEMVEKIIQKIDEE